MQTWTWPVAAALAGLFGANLYAEDGPGDDSGKTRTEMPAHHKGGGHKHKAGGARHHGGKHATHGKRHGKSAKTGHGHRKHDANS